VEADYVHETRLAPTEQIFAKLKKQKGSWEEFERAYNELLEERKIAQELPRSLFDAEGNRYCSAVNTMRPTAIGDWRPNT